ncbi:hypothetical protein L915_11524 [Phytophthora nicotianae]|uniref:Ubiquitin-like protease family profile domain-containing protein n=2 Tax=Phytophthora nicotianae TaxID=4792 RepID=W2GJN4_PHYNI|nr:hypothetical protein L915_11524 [Phytophthora nicotianae]
MAEIEDEAGFEAMLNFVMNQWRNVRQRKGIAVSIPPEGSRTDARWTVVNGPGHSTGAFTEAQVKSEFGISSSEDDGDGGDTLDQGLQDKGVKTRLNPKAKKKWGDHTEERHDCRRKKKDRQRYEAAEKSRETAGEVALETLLSSLEREQPGLVETQRRLSGVLMKPGNTEKKKPKYKVLKNPVLILDPFFILPTNLLDACIKVLPVANTSDTAISIDNSQASSQGTNPQTNSARGDVETIVIKDRTRNNEVYPVDEAIRADIRQHVGDDAIETVMLPLNFNYFHWCCIVIKVKEKRIYYYDLLNHAAYMNAVNGVATSLKITALHEFEVIP